MARRANNPDEFQGAHYALEDLLKDQPVDNGELFQHWEAAETAGQAVAGRGDRTAGYVAKFLHKDLIAMSSAEVVPPLSEDQEKLVAEKAGFYAMLLDNDPASKTKRTPKPTPTDAIDTAARK